MKFRFYKDFDGLWVCQHQYTRTKEGLFFSYKVKEWAFVSEQYSDESDEMFLGKVRNKLQFLLKDEKAKNHKPVYHEFSAEEILKPDFKLPE